MYKINGKTFWETPYMCGGCKFYLSYGKGDLGKERLGGFCTLFNKRKSYYADIPKRCKTLFEKAELFPEGTELCIVEKD